MKLYIDDIRNAPDESWSVARTVRSAIAFIHQFGSEIEHISLDHDISHQVAVGALSRPYPCEETFASVAYFLGAYYRDREQPKITLHTANPKGAQTMENILAQYNLVCEIQLSNPVNRLEM